jgi:HAD superfamily hydrolase (TIGR01509 family)
MKTILVDAIGSFIIKGEGMSKEMYDLLKQYPNPKIILTSVEPENMAEYKMVNLPYPVFTLSHNPEKIDPEYFKKMLENYSLSPSDVIYFEHSPKAQETAESVGIKTMFYDEEKKDLEELKKFFDENLKD